jgi:hypothetical protein
LNFNKTKKKKKKIPILLLRKEKIGKRKDHFGPAYFIEECSARVFF